MAAGWRVRRAALRMQAQVCRRLYRDRAGDEARARIVAGTGRSGSTWVSELVVSQAPCRLMFEPFDNRKITDVAEQHYFPYLRPGDRHPALEAYCLRLLRGEIRHPWIDHQVRTLFPRYRLIKAIRANLLLRWLRERFPRLPMVLLLRHPCAVVASRLALDWATDGDIGPFLSQPALVEDFLAERMPVLRAARSPAAKHAVIWCVSNLVPLRQFASGTLPVLFYEQLCLRPREAVPALFAALEMPFEEAVFDRVALPSTTTARSSAIARGDSRVEGWRSRLTDEQVAEVLEVVRGFGLDGLYDDRPEPRTVDPWSALA